MHVEFSNVSEIPVCFERVRPICEFYSNWKVGRFAKQILHNREYAMLRVSTQYGDLIWHNGVLV